MALMEFREGTVEVDIQSELSKYPFENDRWTPDRLICSSPFRDDNAPSFFVDLESGGWGDSGANTDDTKRGNFLTLIQKLYGYTKSEAIEYLMSNHDVVYRVGEKKYTKFPVVEKKRERSLKVECTDEIVFEAGTRLVKRGISKETQNLLGVGYNPNVKYHTALVWFNREGEMVNVKYRSTKGKRFFYSKTGEPIRHHLYGIQMHKYINSKLVVVEGEIDALSFWEIGVPAVAVGSSSINKRQSRLLRTLNVTEIILGGDNDEQGLYLNAKIAEEFSNQYSLSLLNYGDYSDPNEVLQREGAGGLLSVYNNRKRLDRLEI